MIEVPLMIVNKLGLHARSAARFVATASRFSSHIELRKADQVVNGKSIMGVMMLAASQHTVLTLSVNGEDEQAACDALCTLVAERFGEAE